MHVVFISKEQNIIPYTRGEACCIRLAGNLSAVSSSQFCFVQLWFNPKLFHLPGLFPCGLLLPKFFKWSIICTRCPWPLVHRANSSLSTDSIFNIKLDSPWSQILGDVCRVPDPLLSCGSLSIMWATIEPVPEPKQSMMSQSQKMNVRNTCVIRDALSLLRL